MLLSVTGVAGYLAYVATRTGSLTGWFTVQSTGWDGSFDGGATTLNYLGNVLGGHATTTYDLVTALTLIGVLVLLGLCVAMRVPWPLFAYAAATVATVWLSSGVMNSKVRLLMTAFVLLLPVALGLARRRPATAVAVVGAASIASAWFGGYALTVWQYAI